ALAAPAGVAERTWRGSSNLLVSGLERGGAPSAIRTSLTGRTCLLGASVVSEDGSLASPFANSAVSSSRGASTALGARGRGRDCTPAASLSSTRRTMSEAPACRYW